MKDRVRQEWKGFWQERINKLMFFLNIGFFFGLIVFVPSYFNFIQNRQGTLLNDYLLELIPSKDVSIPIFCIIYSTALYLLYRILAKPKFFLFFLLAFNLETVFRMISIYFLPLEPPTNWVLLEDPFASIFIYGKGEIVTKDLFFSGHTATMLLAVFFLPKRREKIVASCMTVFLVSLLLVQHIHYTLDIIGAFFFTFFAYILAKKILEKLGV